MVNDMAKKKTDTPEEATEEVVDEKIQEEKSSEITDEAAQEEVTQTEDGESSTPKEKKKVGKTIMLFNRWSFDGIEVKDLSLQGYINLNPVIIPHSGGKHQHKRFWKTEHISIVERFINKIMTPGLVGKRIKGRGSSHNMGKKQKVIKMVYNAFALIEYKTGLNPIQVLVSSVEKAAPREETTRISMGGISYQQAVDIAPQRRVDLALKLIVQGTVGQAYNNIKTIDELLANELILCAKNDNNSRSINRKDEMERVAISAR
jgi:small subunit ribosomal protein S7